MKNIPRKACPERGRRGAKAQSSEGKVHHEGHEGKTKNLEVVPYKGDDDN
jgi:hypothetical protein